jgi:hypothetical protein
LTAASDSTRRGGRALPFVADEFDAVVLDSTLSHVPGPERALAEAFRVLRSGGVLAVFDGDCATATVALGDHDPLQVYADAMMANLVTDRWLVRRLQALVTGCGFGVAGFRSHGYILTIIDRGADLLRGLGHIGEATAAALKAEARQRAAGAFCGHIAYESLVARKPA